MHIGKWFQFERKDNKSHIEFYQCGEIGAYCRVTVADAEL